MEWPGPATKPEIAVVENLAMLFNGGLILE
jgi:hypothetical protein